MTNQLRTSFTWISGEALGRMLLIFCFASGGLAACICAASLAKTSCNALQDFLQNNFFIEKEAKNAIGYGIILWNQLKIPSMIFLLGFTRAGVFAIPALLLYEGFGLGFASACMFRLYGWAGMASAGVLFGLRAVLRIPALLLLGQQALIFSRRNFHRDGGRAVWPPLIDRVYRFSVLISGTLFFLSSVAEYWILPLLIDVSAALL